MNIAAAREDWNARGREAGKQIVAREWNYEMRADL